MYITCLDMEGVLVPGGSVDPAEICRALGQTLDQLFWED